jgi:uncharacterized protein YndB with AHSA1/START domain
MSTETVLVSEVIAAPKERLYAAWLDSDEHSAFIADVAAVEPFVGGSHSSFGGYATGKVLALEPNQKIVQSWRASDFPDGAPDSRLEVTFEETVGGTLITVLHTGLPVGQSDRYRDGWLRHYFAPMKTYFASDGDDEIVDRTSESNGTSDGDTEELSVSASQIESMTAVISDIGEDDGGEDDADEEVAAPAPKPARAKPARARPRPVKKAAAARSKGAKKKASKIARPAARTKAAAKRGSKGAPKAKAKGKAKAKPKAAPAKAKKAAKKPAKKAKKSRR